MERRQTSRCSGPGARVARPPSARPGCSAYSKQADNGATMVGGAREIAITRRVRPPAIFKRSVRLLPLLLLLCVTPTAQPAPSWNVGYRKIDVQDALTGEPFPVALWYPTPAAPAPLFVTDSLSPCRLPAVLCRWIAFEMPVAHNAPPAVAHFGLIVVSHGGGGLAVNHRDLAMVL